LGTVTPVGIEITEHLPRGFYGEIVELERFGNPVPIQKAAPTRPADESHRRRTLYYGEPPQQLDRFGNVIQ
jgi:hypothetical protein